MLRRALIHFRVTRCRVATGLKIAALVVCATFAIQGRPPAFSQVMPRTIKDAQQDDAIVALRGEFVGSKGEFDRRVDQNRQSLQRQWDAINAIHSEIADVRADVAGIKGENRYEFGGLGALYGAGILVQRKKKKVSEA